MEFESFAGCLPPDLGSESRNAVIMKAQEIRRKSLVKFSVGLLGKSECFRNPIAFEFACKMLNQPFNRKHLLASCGIGNKIAADYAKTFQVLANSLQIQLDTSNALKQLVVRFGDHVKIRANELAAGKLDTFGNASLAAAFYIALKEMKIPVDKSLLCGICCIDPKSLKMNVQAFGQNGDKKPTNPTADTVNTSKDKGSSNLMSLTAYLDNMNAPRERLAENRPDPNGATINNVVSSKRSKTEHSPPVCIKHVGKIVDPPVACPRQAVVSSRQNVVEKSFLVPSPQPEDGAAVAAVQPQTSDTEKRYEAECLRPNAADEHRTKYLELKKQFLSKKRVYDML